MSASGVEIEFDDIALVDDRQIFSLAGMSQSVPAFLQRMPPHCSMRALSVESARTGSITMRASSSTEIFTSSPMLR